MSDLTDEQKEEIEAVLKSFDEDTLNLIALDRKYDELWYKEHLKSLYEARIFFDEVAEVMKLNDKREVAEACFEYRRQIESVITVYENALEDLEDEDTGQIWPGQ